MKKAVHLSILLLVTFIFSASNSSGFSLEELGLGLDAGYRKDDINWNHASNLDGTSTPNIRSELTWSDLEIYQIRAKGDIALKPANADFSLTARGHLGYGWIYRGKNQDSDYDGDNRTLEFSRSNNNGGDGSVFDALIGFGPRFTVIKSAKENTLLKADSILSITPLIGWSYHEQNLTITDGYQTIPATGSFDDLDSSYDAEWYGPWIGLDLEGNPSDKFRIYLGFEYHLHTTYYGETNWNLQPLFQHPKSMEQNADGGTGLIISNQYSYAFSESFRVTLDLNYQDWKVEDGTHTFNMATGTKITYKLNEVNWTSSGAMLGMHFRFK